MCDACEVSFGVVALGFTFRRSVQLCNHHTLPERIRITVASASPDDLNVLKVLTAPKTLAPGMTMALELELHAHTQRHSVFVVHVTSPLNCREIPVTASVVNRDLFESLSSALKHEGRTVLDAAVKLGSRMAESEPKNATALESTVDTTADMKSKAQDEDLALMPLSPATYWDPWQQSLKVDPQLLRVETHPDWDLETAKRRNEDRTSRRLHELESMGMVTYRRRIER